MPATEQSPLIVEVHDGQAGYVRANHWALPYASNHLLLNGGGGGDGDGDRNTDRAMLEHVNCSYLSTPGRPPTLLALKQHAQSLAALISQVSPCREGAAAEVDNENKTKNNSSRKGKRGARFAADEAFDWLNNLRVPYDTLDPAHRRPLNSLANLVRSNSDTGGVRFHCPLDELLLPSSSSSMSSDEQDQEQQQRHFESHATLLLHANECLERLDHEFSALGGLLSIIPPVGQDGSGDGGGAGDTLVGQWILFTQHLVARMHELEIAYANCLDLLAGERAVPNYASSSSPASLSSTTCPGQEQHHPQGDGDNSRQPPWAVFANAGDGVHDFLHAALDAQEAADAAGDAVHRGRGVVGDALRLQQQGSRGDDDYDDMRGLVGVDIPTRYYRLRGQGGENSNPPKGTIFVMPAHGARPDTWPARDLEARPTVVAVPAPSPRPAHVRSEAAPSAGTSPALDRRLELQRAEAERQRAIAAAYERAAGAGAGTIEPTEQAEEMSAAHREATAATAVGQSRGKSEGEGESAHSLRVKVDRLEKELAVYRDVVARHYGEDRIGRSA